MIRRLKRDVLQQLPSKRRQQVILALDADAKKQLAGLQKQARCQDCSNAGPGLSALPACLPWHCAYRRPACLRVQLEVARQIMGEEARKSAASGGAAG